MIFENSPITVKEKEDGDRKYLIAYLDGKELPYQIEVTIKDSIEEVATVQVTMYLGGIEKK